MKKLNIRELLCTKITRFWNENFRKWINKCGASKTTAIVKWILKELFIGVIVGIAVVIATSYMDERERYNQLKQNLALVHIGESYEYLNSMFGIPIINEIGGEKREVYYKLDDAVLRCIFDNDELIAYIITVNSKNMYSVKANLYTEAPLKLLQFSYSDFSKNAGKIEWNVPANNDDYAYYQEIFYGAGPADYNYFIIGNYKDYRKESVYNELLSWLASDLSQTPENIDKKRLQKYRKMLKPNTYGMIKEGYENDIDIIGDNDNIRNYGEILFGR